MHWWEGVVTRQVRNTILQGDALARLRELPPASVDSIISSPPYYRLRDYDMVGQIGLEETVEAWVERLLPVFQELDRVLKPTGSMWLDLGDTYSRRTTHGARPKSLLLAPERLIMALTRRGWILRNRIVWAKTAPMPSGVTDRLESTHDVVYFLVRSRRYFFDLDAIRNRVGKSGHLGRNPGDVWRLPIARFTGAHFATFPTDLVTRPLVATCPARVCVACGAPWHTRTSIRRLGRVVRFKRDPFVRIHPVRYRVIRTNPRLVRGCQCQAFTRPGLVLDPFFGTGTVGAVAEQQGRDWLGIELNPSYCQLAWQRIRGLPVRRVA
jgi:site-specific DNA-methyltransferase (adenine-specific)